MTRIGDDIEQIIGAGGAGVDVGDKEPVGSADELPRKLAPRHKLRARPVSRRR